MAPTAAEQEFARLVGSGKFTQTAAYSQAFDVSKIQPGTVIKRASALAKREDIKALIAVVVEGAGVASVKAAAYTIDVAIAEADEARADAKANGQASAQVAAIKLKSQLAGHVLDRKEIKAVDPLKDATTEELGRLRDEITRRIVAAKDAELVTGVAHLELRKAA